MVRNSSIYSFPCRFLQFSNGKAGIFLGFLWGDSDDFWSFFVTLGHIDFVLATLGHFGVILLGVFGGHFS